MLLRLRNRKTDAAPNVVIKKVKPGPAGSPQQSSLHACSYRIHSFVSIGASHGIGETDGIAQSRVLVSIHSVRQ